MNISLSLISRDLLLFVNENSRYGTGGEVVTNLSSVVIEMTYGVRRTACLYLNLACLFGPDGIATLILRSFVVPSRNIAQLMNGI